MKAYIDLPFDNRIPLVEQVEVTEKEDTIKVVAYTNNWWSKWMIGGLYLLGAVCCFGAFMWLVKWLDASSHSSPYFSLGLFGFLLVAGVTCIKNSIPLSQNRLEFLLEEDFFTVQQSTFIFQENQKYLYEEIVAIQGVPLFQIITRNQQYSKVWGSNLLPEQWRYLAAALNPIWREPNSEKTTGEEEDWSEHLIE